MFSTCSYDRCPFRSVFRVQTFSEVQTSECDVFIRVIGDIAIRPKKEQHAEREAPQAVSAVTPGGPLPWPLGLSGGSNEPNLDARRLRIND